MKQKFNIIFIAVFVISNIINAQESLLNFQEQDMLINGVSVNVGNTMLKGDEKQINKSWISFVKTHLDKKMKKEDGVLVIK